MGSLDHPWNKLEDAYGEGGWAVEVGSLVPRISTRGISFPSELNTLDMHKRESPRPMFEVKTKSMPQVNLEANRLAAYGQVDIGV